MDSGKIVGGPFRIESLAGQGGAGSIFRALDLPTGRVVALKTIRGVGAQDQARFLREARVLSQLEHPALVRYLAHGTDDDGASYLAMEWLEGEDLRARLAREGLTLAETLALGRRVAEVLALLHANGLVHRDIKPGNLFLCAGRPDQVKVLDLGLVRGYGEQISLTHTGIAVGTPGYMAPEQARGERDLDARADIFSLGCVLYRCLSGKAPFEGAHMVEIMTKVLLEEPVSLASLCPSVPPELASLVHRMLQKEADQRPRSGAEVASALAGIALSDSIAGISAPKPTLRLSTLTAEERRLVSVILVGPQLERESTGGHQSDSGARQGGASRDLEEPRSITEVLHAYGAITTRIAGDARVVHLSGSESPAGDVARAARCALALRAALPGAAIAFATGRSEASGRAPVGDAIERATGLLGQEQADMAAALAAGQPSPESIAIDSVTASLLGASFDVREISGRWRLVGISESSASGRTVLGKQTPLVGREWEIGTITGVFRSCVDEPAARAVLVTGASGAGKSRLAREVRGALREVSPDMEVWRAAGVSSSAGSPFSLLAGLIKSALDLQPEAEERQLFEALRRKLPPEEADRAAEVLADVMGMPLSAPSAALRAARSDPRIFAERTRETWEQLVSATTAARPLLVLIEDLHWGDPPTTRLLGDALSRLQEKPWMLLGFGRPEVVTLFPHLLHERDCQHIRLRPLTKKAAEALVRHVLGKDASAATVSRIVAQADGNAFFLEELIRAFATHESSAEHDTLPDTVLAVVQTRLAFLDPEARRLLRAASVIGEVFWTSAVEALIGREASWSPSQWVDELVTQEILVRRSFSRFVGETELGFRHSLLREGAYSMLTETDRVLGHRLAGEWLERRGETDPLVLAKHFDEGGDPQRAVPRYVEAARRAVSGLDLTTAVTLGERAVALDAAGEQKVQNHLLLTEAHLWRSDWAKVLVHGEEVLRAAAPGSDAWLRALTLKQGAALSSGDVRGMKESVAALTSVEIAPDARPAAIRAFGATAIALGMGLQIGAARDLLGRLEALIAAEPERHLVPLGIAMFSRGVMKAWGDGDPLGAINDYQAACAYFDEAADRQNLGYLHGVKGLCHADSGAYEAAEQELASIDRSAERGTLIGTGREHLRVALLLAKGEHDEVRATAARILAEAEKGDRKAAMRACFARAWLSEIAGREGDLETAEREGTLAAPALRVTTPTSWPSWPAAAAALARIKLRRGRAAEALADTKEVLDYLQAHGASGAGAPEVKLVRAEALLASGDPEAARALLREARDRLLQVAANADDEPSRTAYLHRVPAHDRILSLAADMESGLPSPATPAPPGA